MHARKCRYVLHFFILASGDIYINYDLLLSRRLIRSILRFDNIVSKFMDLPVSIVTS